MLVFDASFQSLSMKTTLTKPNVQDCLQTSPYVAIHDKTRLECKIWNPHMPIISATLYCDLVYLSSEEIMQQNKAQHHSA